MWVCLIICQRDGFERCLSDKGRVPKNAILLQEFDCFNDRLCCVIAMVC